MKYVVLIHSNPQPWGHPTADYLDAFQALPAGQRSALAADFDALLAEIGDSGELIGGQALAAPAAARLFRWQGGAPTAVDGPYSESKEHFAGFFLIDVVNADRAEQIARRMAGPGETVELRPAMGSGAPEQ